MPDPTTQPRIQIITSAELLDLAENLRRIGFVLDTGQYLRAHQAGDILLALDFEGRLDSIERLRTVLAPIFCGTPDEQETFYAFFDEWLARNPQIIERIGLSRKDEQPFVHEPRVVGEQQQEQSREQRKWWAWVVGITVILVAGWLGQKYFMPDRSMDAPKRKTIVFGSVTDAQDNTPIVNARVTNQNDSTETDSAGHFVLPHRERFLLTDKGGLAIYHEAYLQPNSLTFESSDSDTSFAFFKLWKNLGPQKLTTRVLDANTRTPLQSAIVTFLDETKTTDQNGRIEFTYLPKDGAANITSELDGYLPASKTTPIHGHGASDIEITMQPVPPAEVDSLHTLVGRINAYADSVTARQPLTELQRFYQDNFGMIRTAGLALPFALFVLWWFSRWLRRRMLLERQTTTVTPKTGAVVVKGAADYLFRNTAFRRTVQQLRQHREVSSTDLNAPATVDATLRCGGLFTPVFASRFISPEYLILIDRASFGDQHAGFIDALVKRMVSDGVIVDRYYFDRDPRICQPENLDKPHSTIQELFVRHPKHRLLIFSDAAGFLDTLTGRPQHWLDDFLEWSSSAIFIPERTDDADYLEYALQDFGFSVGPATTAGLSKHLVQEASSKGQGGKGQWDRDKPFPDMLEEHSDLWLDRQPPPEQKIDNLIATLRDFLEPDGFDWLCACAVYPELHWELTLYLATHLKMGDAHTLTGDEQVFVQKCLTDLTRLPWFRQGYMPDWLRLRLVAEMSREQHLAVRRILDGLLKEADRPEEDRPLDGFTLPFAHKSLATLKAAVLGKLGLLSDESPLDDYVFANYMSGGKPGRLAVFVPEAVKKLFFRDGQTVLGMRPFMALLLAGAFCGFNWLGLTAMQPQPHIAPPVPTFSVQESHDLPGVDGPVARSDSALVHYLHNYMAQENILIAADSILTYSAIYNFDYRKWLATELDDNVGFNRAMFAFYADLPFDTTNLFGKSIENELLYITLDDSLASVDELKEIWHNDTLTVLEKQQRFRDVVSDRSRGFWEQKYAREQLASLDSIARISATVTDESNFVMCSGIQNSNPVGVRSVFAPGNVYAWVRVNSPRVEFLTFKWLANGIEIADQIAEVRVDTVTGWRAYKYKTFLFKTLSARQTGRYEVRLYNGLDYLIGRRVFEVSADMPDRKKPRYDITLRRNRVPDQIISGQEFDYRVTVVNNGPDGAGAFRVRMYTPEGLANLIPVQPANLTPLQLPDSLSWDVHSLAPKEQIILGFDGTLDASATGLQGVHTDIRNAEGDTNPVNNHLVDTLRVAPLMAQQQAPPPEEQAKKPTEEFANKAPDLTQPEPLRPITPLRSVPDASLTADEVRQMLRDKDFYDGKRNQRGRGLENRFVSQVFQGDNVVVDNNSGLMWQQSGSSNASIIQDAEKHIRDLNARKFGGYSDWKLPTLEEAMSLMEPERNRESNLYIDPVFDSKQDWIWTSDLYPSSGGAWFVSFRYGECYWSDLNDDNYARAVRSINAQPKTTLDQPPTESLEAFARRMNNARALIPAGRFRMGSENGDDDEQPVHTVKVDSFYMDKYEVTVAQYKLFLDANPKQRKPEEWDKQLQNFRRPVVYVSWHDAKAYADWADKKLPTEAQWEYAARGGFTGQDGKPRYKYPWGDAIDSSKANYFVQGRTTYDWQKDFRRVGTYPPNGYGLHDMAGNVWEWCADWYDSGYYKQFADSSVVNNPLGPEKSNFRVLRGGSWYYGPLNIRCANRGRSIPSIRNDGVGFRCSQDVF